MLISEIITQAVAERSVAYKSLERARDLCDKVYDPDRVATGVRFNDVLEVMTKVDNFQKWLRKHKEEAVAEGH